MNIHRKLYLLFTVLVISIIMIGSYSASTYHKIIDEENFIHREAERNVSLVQLIQLHLKNQQLAINHLLLIKSNEPASNLHSQSTDGRYYLSEVEVVKKYTSKLSTNLSHSVETTRLIAEFNSAYASLNSQYQARLKSHVKLLVGVDKQNPEQLIDDITVETTRKLNSIIASIITHKESSIVEAEENLSQQELTMLLITTTVLVILFMLFHFITKKTIINPLHQLHQAAININKGIYDTQLVCTGNDEISAVGDTFNKLSDRLSSYSSYMENSLKEVTQLVSSLDDANSTITKEDVRIRAILDNMSDVIITITEEGEIQSINAAVITLFGEKESAYFGKSLTVLLPTKLCQFIPSMPMPHEMETYIKRKDNRKVPVEITINKFILDSNPMYVIAIHDIEQRKISENKLIELANYDPLTRLPNRNYFQERLNNTLSKTTKKRPFTAIMFVDLDGFKRINDTLGHTSGDSLLGQFATRLQSSVRHCDTVARWGGDEFIILIDNVKSRSLIKKMAQEILNSMSDAFNLNGHEIFSSVSIGISISNAKKDDAESLLRQADIAMHHAKDEGKNQYQFYTSKMNARGFERLQLETQLRQSMWNKEFFLHFQPQIDIRTGEITGAEALARWQHPEKGLISPLDFIPLLEETGLVIPVGEYLLQIACKQAAEWQRNGNPDFRISVNLSARQFDDKHLVNKVRRILDETGLAPEHLELEITESAMMRDANKTARILTTFAKMGVDIAIDDFGTGHSSLSYLRQYPISTLKIDRSFVSELESEADDRAISQTIINMANNLRMRVVAEGVETEEQLAILKGQGCDIVQGYYYSRPLPSDDFMLYLSKVNCKQVA